MATRTKTKGNKMATRTKTKGNKMATRTKTKGNKMATRTKTYMKCGRLGCRKRRGVTRIKVTIEEMPTVANTKPVELGPGNLNKILLGIKGQLCPAHVKLMLAQAKGWFNNTKKDED